MSDIRERIRELWAQGMSKRDIAERLQISYGSVSGHRNRMNLPAHPSVVDRAAPGGGQEWDGARKRRIEELRDEGRSWRQIAHVFGVSDGMVKYRAARWGMDMRLAVVPRRPPAPVRERQPVREVPPESSAMPSEFRPPTMRVAPVTLPPSYHKGCQFLVGPDTGRIGRHLPFCEAVTAGGGSYCAEHYRVCAGGAAAGMPVAQVRV